jgi:protein-disulfide isomerase
VIHAGLAYRIILAIGILLPLSGCGRGDATQAEVEALRGEVAQMKQAQAAMQSTLAALQQASKAAPAAVPSTEAADSAAPVQIPTVWAPRKGNPDAAVMVVEFADFQCPFCQSAAGLPDQLVAEFPNDIQFAFKHYPLDRHQYALGAAKAAWAAQQQGKFWEMHNLIYSGNIDESGVEVLRGYAQKLGLDMARFDADMTSAKAQQAVLFDKQAGRTIKLGGTPAYFVNGRRVNDRSPAGVRALIVEEIAKSKPDAAP